MSETGTAWLYRFENGYGAVVTDCAEYGAPAHDKTLKLVEFFATDNWLSLDYFRTHLNDAQVEAIFERIQKGEITE